MCGRIQNSVGSTALKGALVAVMMRVKHPEERIKLQALSVSGMCTYIMYVCIIVHTSDTHVPAHVYICIMMHSYSLTYVAPRILCDQLR